MVDNCFRMSSRAGVPSCFYDPDPNEDNWDDAPHHPSYLNSLPAHASKFLRESDAFLEMRRNDDDARRYREERGVWNVCLRPYLSFEDLIDCLESHEWFHSRQNRVHMPPLKEDRQYKLNDHHLIKKLYNNVDRWRIMSVDTENTGEKIFLICGDPQGNCVFFNDARNTPKEIVELLEDVKVFKIQSNVEQDYKILKRVGIEMCGTCDTQTIYTAFCNPGGSAGTHNQARFTGHPERRFNVFQMNFLSKTVNGLSIDHATSDARQPIMTLFKAAHLRALSLPVAYQRDDDCFKLVWDVLNRCAGVSVQVAQHGIQNTKSVEENWLTSKSDKYVSNNINNKPRLREIEAAQQDWPLRRDKARERLIAKLHRTDAMRKAHNQRRSAASKVRRAEKRAAKLAEQRRERRASAKKAKM